MESAELVEREESERWIFLVLVEGRKDGKIHARPETDATRRDDRIVSVVSIAPSLHCTTAAIIISPAGEPCVDTD